MIYNHRPAAVLGILESHAQSHSPLVVGMNSVLNSYNPMFSFHSRDRFV